MALPEMYKWLLKEPAPKMLKEALKLYDTKEVAGKENNPVIMQWAAEIGGNVKRDYDADSVFWCGLFIGIIARRANKELPTDPLWALIWSNFGKVTNMPMLGDVLTFTREGGGHVGLYVGEDKDCYHVLGGNQSDKVCITRLEKSRLYVARRPNYNLQPSNVRVIKLISSGSISTNEQ